MNQHLSYAALLMSLIFFRTAAFANANANANANVVSKVSEARLVEIANVQGEYSEISHIADFVEIMRSCGLVGEVIVVHAPPAEGTPDLRGLHYLVRDVEPSVRCHSGQWPLLDHPLQRHRMRQIVRSGRLLFVALETLRHYHSAVADPEIDPFADKVRTSLSREASPDWLVFLGRKALLGDPRAAGLTRDLLDLSGWPFPSAILLAVSELISRSARAETENPYTTATQSAPGAGLIEIKFDTDFQEIRPTRQIPLRALLIALKATPPHPRSARELSQLLTPYLNAGEAHMFGAFVGTKCEQDLLPRWRN